MRETKRQVSFGVYLLMTAVFLVLVMDSAGYAGSEDVREYYERTTRSGRKNQIPPLQLRTSEPGRGVLEQLQIPAIMATLKYELARKGGFPELDSKTRRELLQIISDPNLVMDYTDKQPRISGSTSGGQATDKNRFVTHQATFFDSAGDKVSNHKIGQRLLHELGHVHQLRHSLVSIPFVQEWFPNSLEPQLREENFSPENLDNLSEYIEERKSGKADKKNDLAWLRNTAGPAPVQPSQPPSGGQTGPAAVPPPVDISKLGESGLDGNSMPNDFSSLIDALGLAFGESTDKQPTDRDPANDDSGSNRTRNDRSSGSRPSDPTGRSDDNVGSRQQRQDKMQPVVVRGVFPSDVFPLTAPVTMQVSRNGTATLSTMSMNLPSNLLNGSIKFSTASGDKIVTRPNKQGGPPVPVSATFYGSVEYRGFDLIGNVEQGKKGILVQVDRREDGSWVLRQTRGDAGMPPLVLKPVGR